MLHKLKVAVVHDFLVAYGGAERVLEVLCEMFPDAPIYTLLYDKEKMKGKFEGKKIHASFLQKFPKFLRKRYRYLLPFMPTAPETFDLRDFDLIISSSGAWSKGIVTRLDVPHVCYMHSPMRFVWDESDQYLRQQQKKGWQAFFIRLVLSYIRVWDKAAADRPDCIIANSKYTQDRIKKYYGRESMVIYPPLPCETKNSSEARLKSAKGYFLVVARLSPYKKVNMIVEAFNKLELPLVVVGEGNQKKYLRSIAKENVKIIGWQGEDKLQQYYQNARCVVHAAVEDFGLTVAEAMAHGVPALAIRKGGVKEILSEGKTGEFFDAATPEVIADGVRRFMENEKRYDREFIKSEAEKFSKERFILEFSKFILNRHEYYRS